MPRVTRVRYPQSKAASSRLTLHFPCLPTSNSVSLSPLVDPLRRLPLSISSQVNTTTVRDRTGQTKRLLGGWEAKIGLCEPGQSGARIAAWLRAAAPVFPGGLQVGERGETRSPDLSLLQLARLPQCLGPLLGCPLQTLGAQGLDSLRRASLAAGTGPPVGVLDPAQDGLDDLAAAGPAHTLHRTGGSRSGSFDSRRTCSSRAVAVGDAPPPAPAAAPVPRRSCFPSCHAAGSVSARSASSVVFIRAFPQG